MSDYYLNGTIDRFEGKTAIIILDHQGEKLLWPKAKLPATAAEGASVKLWLEPNPIQEKTNEQTAKNFLNDILQN